MTAPTTLPVLPTATRPTGAGRASTAAGDDGAPAFASALDDALAGPRSTGGSAGRGTERAAERASERAAERASDRSAVRGKNRPAVPGQDDSSDRTTEARADDTEPPADPTAAAAPAAEPASTVVVAPGLWALLAAATPAAPTASTTPTPGTDAGSTVAATATVGVTGASDPTAPGMSVAPSLAAAGAAATAPAGAVPPAAPPTVLPFPAAPPAARADVTDLAQATGLTVVLDPTPAPTVAAPIVAAPAASAPDIPAPASDVRTDEPADLVTGLPVTGSGGAPEPGSDGAAGDSTPGLPSAVDLVPAPDTGSDSFVPLTTTTPATTAPPAATGSPAPAPPAHAVAQQLGPQLAVLRYAPDGSQTMTVVITPESLGPVTVAVTITKGTLDLTLHGAHDAGRHALAAALPELRRELEGVGLTFSRLELDSSGGGPGAAQRDAQQQLLDARAGQQGSESRSGRQEPRARSWDPAARPLGEGSAAPTTDQSASSGVDVRV